MFELHTYQTISMVLIPLSMGVASIPYIFMAHYWRNIERLRGDLNTGLSLEVLNVWNWRKAYQHGHLLRINLFLMSLLFALLIFCLSSIEGTLNEVSNVALVSILGLLSLVLGGQVFWNMSRYDLAFVCRLLTLPSKGSQYRRLGADISQALCYDTVSKNGGFADKNLEDVQEWLRFAANLRSMDKDKQLKHHLDSLFLSKKDQPNLFVQTQNVFSSEEYFESFFSDTSGTFRKDYFKKLKEMNDDLERALENRDMLTLKKIKSDKKTVDAERFGTLTHPITTSGNSATQKRKNTKRLHTITEAVGSSPNWITHKVTMDGDYSQIKEVLMYVQDDKLGPGSMDVTKINPVSKPQIEKGEKNINNDIAFSNEEVNVLLFQSLRYDVNGSIQKLSSIFTDIVFHYSFADDENIGLCVGSISYKEGNIINSSIPKENTTEARTLAMEILGV